MVKLNIHIIDSKSSHDNKESDLIDLKESSKIFGYTQHHFGLLCRQGKLRARRVGKKWLTKKEWVEEYLKEVEANYKKSNIHYTQLNPRKKEYEKPVIMPVRDKERHIFEWSSVPPGTKPKRKEGGALPKNAITISFIAALLWSYAFVGTYLSEGYPVVQGRVNQLVAGDYEVINDSLRAVNKNVKDNYIEISNKFMAGTMKLGYFYINVDRNLDNLIGGVQSQTKIKLSTIRDSYLANVGSKKVPAIVMWKIRDLFYLIGTSIQKVVPSF